MKHFIDRDDLTRWSRGGLQRFRYVDANAVSLLEALRVLMTEAFTSGGVNQWQDLDTAIPVPGDENSQEREARWQQQYRGERRDYAWEILRSYARSNHILLEYLDAYANENFIRTARDWNHVRRLVEMLGYHPAPAASAQTTLGLLAKEDEAGEVSAGFAVKNVPKDGSQPLVFETLDDLEVDWQLNELRTTDWNQSQRLFDYEASSDSAVFPLAAPSENISVGSPGVLLVATDSQSYGVAVLVAAIDEAQLTLDCAEPETALPATIRDHQVTLLMEPGQKRKPLLYGDDVVALDEDHGLSLGSVVAWQQGSSWRASEVVALSGNRMRFSPLVPASGKTLYLADFSEANDYEVSGSTERRIVLPTHINDEREYPAAWDQNLNKLSDSHSHATEGSTTLFDYFPNPTQERIYYVPIRDPIAEVQSSGDSQLVLEGKAKNLKSGDWIVVQDDAGDYHCAQVESIQDDAEGVVLALDRSFDHVASVWWQFEQTLRPKDHDKNMEPAFLTSAAIRSSSHSTLPLALAQAPELLRTGRELLVVGKYSAVAVTVKTWDETLQQLVVAPALPGSEPGGPDTSDDFTRYDTFIYGNVVAAGHGETQSKKILGSGDATQSNQSFHLDVDDVSFVTDPQFASGVRADLIIKVEGREYQQVSNFDASEKEDPHYTVRVQQDGTLKITFGDGTRARRLPTGSNNISVICRSGNGLKGNLQAYSLVKAVKPHYLVDSLVQPILASGGNDMESAEAMRSHAPATTLTLERAVSVQDFANLSKANSGVWEAAARLETLGRQRREKVSVVVVPAGGGDLGSLADSLTQTLVSHSLPAINVAVTRYQALLMSMHLIVRVKTSEYDPDEVKAAVLETLYNSFSLEKAKLGASIYRSQFFQVVEAVTGVENCQVQVNNSFVDESGATATPASVVLTSAGHIKRVTPAWNQVLYLHESLSGLTIEVVDYVL